MHKTFRYTICNQPLGPQTSCVEKKKKMCLQRCREVHGKRKTQEKSRFVYLAFVKVVDDFLVEPLFQLPLRRRLVPVPLGEVGRTQVL